MKFVADLHLHSKYSRAVSQNMVLPKMAQWAGYKGINVLATGDFTHPFWLDQLKKELEDTGRGLYRLKSENSFTPGVRDAVSGHTPGVSLGSGVYFLLSCEISSIYSQGGKGRRVHNLFFFPQLKSVEKFNGELLKRGANLRSDGRPIVGITSRDLAKIALDVDSKALIIPAHAWTPWFSIFGSFSGFDSVEECFVDMAKYIYGIETGLSSDPAMNWQIADLDDRAILSFSDAHSLEKMGREATVFEAEEMSYDSIYGAIRQVGQWAGRSKIENNPTNLQTHGPNYPSNIAFTIEFYPEEGKYHYTGHRDCNVSQSPQETEKSGDVCPACGRHLTVGVMHRVEQLKTRDTRFASRRGPASQRGERTSLSVGEARRAKQETREINGIRWVYPEGSSRPPFVSMVALGEIIAEAFNVGFKTKKVLDCYMILIEKFGSEFGVLLKSDIIDIAKYAPARVVDGIERVRSGKIKVDPGYDGKFGVVKIWDEDSSDQTERVDDQLNLFA